MLALKRYELLYVGDGKGPYSSPKADTRYYSWGQFPAVDKADSIVQGQRIAEHHKLPGNLHVSYLGKWGHAENYQTYVGDN